ncbi:hypothetical protein ACVGWT_00350, partial [Enterobacter hormaechei]
RGRVGAVFARWRYAYRAYGGERGRCLPGGGWLLRAPSELFFFAGIRIPNPRFFLIIKPQQQTPHPQKHPPKKKKKKKKKNKKKKKKKKKKKNIKKI